MVSLEIKSSLFKIFCPDAAKSSGCGECLERTILNFDCHVNRIREAGNDRFGEMASMKIFSHSDYRKLNPAVSLFHNEDSSPMFSPPSNHIPYRTWLRQEDPSRI